MTAVVTHAIDLSAPIVSEKTTILPHLPDGQGFLVHCSGGFRAAKIDTDRWIIEPVMENGHACRKGFFSTSQLYALLRAAGLTSIALQRFGWSGGQYHSHWSPVTPNRSTDPRGASDLWSSIATNGAQERSDSTLDAAQSADEIAQILDDRTQEEWLSLSIALSLRSMDTSVEQICNFYHEQLVNFLTKGAVSGERSGNAGDAALYANVHSFFLHLGSARDYLASFIARRLGMGPKTDSMSRLTKALRAKHFGIQPTLDLLFNRSLIQRSATESRVWEACGWLAEMSDLRNQLVHKRPYGARFTEHFGRASAIAADAGLYRYFRPILIGGIEQDVLDLVALHYKTASNLFREMAEVSGEDISMLTLRDEDILSVERDGDR